MAAPTAVEIGTQFTNAVHWYEEIRELGEVDATNLIGMQDTFSQSIEGKFTPGIAGDLATSRARINAALNALPALTKIFQEYANLADSDFKNSGVSMFRDVFRFFTDNTLSVQARDIVFGTITAGGGNVGNGELVRLTVDEFGNDLEGGHVETKTFRCTRDQTSGTEKNVEQFRMHGDRAGDDRVERETVAGSGKRIGFTAKQPSLSIVRNAGFENWSGTVSAPTDISDWTSSTAVAGDGTDYTLDATNIFLPAPTSTIPRYALNVKLTRTLTQKLVDTRRALGRDVPYVAEIAYNREEGAFTGTLELHLGSRSISVTLAAQTGYNRLRIALDENSWYTNFYEDDLDVKIVVIKTGGTGLLLDDLQVHALKPADGTWWALMPGPTPFVAGSSLALGDTISVADAFNTSDSVIQKWVTRTIGPLFGARSFFLPPSATPSIADP